ncbi:hypothetical protein KJ611_04980 [Patescibacteria group bacterium]|nr:hypothetical protein [Patescibacteria group bacterium]
MARGRRKQSTKADRRRKQRLAALDHPRRMGHETMLIVARPMAKAVDALVAKLRRPPGEPVDLASDDAFTAVPEVDEVLHGRYGFVRQYYDWSHEDGMTEVELLATHIACAANHVLGGRKVFWVDVALAELLAQTTLDVSGDALQLPFPCCAFLFDDAATLGHVQALVDAERGRRPEEPPFQMLTAYASPLPKDKREEGLRLVIMADAFNDEWPYFISRDIVTDDKRNIDEILDSHPDGSTDPFFRSPELRALVHLVINAILYTTCSDFRSEVRTPPAPNRLTRGRNLSGETVFYLPGKIRIGASAATEDRKRTSGYTIGKRFWVRGHWRRANPSWEDQRLRWIAPYLKGPEMTAIIEREYELHTPARRNGSGGGEATSS